MQRLKQIVESQAFSNTIIVLILINAVTLAMETSKSIMAAYGPILLTIDKIILAVFVAEILAKFAVYRHRFFLSGWNVFDLIVVVIALMPATGTLSVLRALRILRVLRLISILPQMRKVVEGLLRALPGMGAIVMLLSLLYFVAAVMATKLFGADHPGYFGTLGDSFFTLFAIMTLEGWADIAREVQTTHPQAYLFFVPFIIVSVFAVLNLFIAVLSNSMGEADREHDDVVRAEQARAQDVLLAEIRTLRSEVEGLRQSIAAGAAQGVPPGR